MISRRLVTERHAHVRPFPGPRPFQTGFGGEPIEFLGYVVITTGQVDIELLMPDVCSLVVKHDLFDLLIGSRSMARFKIDKLIRDKFDKGVEPKHVSPPLPRDLALPIFGNGDKSEQFHFTFR